MIRKRDRDIVQARRCKTAVCVILFVDNESHFLTHPSTAKEGDFWGSCGSANCCTCFRSRCCLLSLWAWRCARSGAAAASCLGLQLSALLTLILQAGSKDLTPEWKLKVKTGFARTRVCDGARDTKRTRWLGRDEGKNLIAASKWIAARRRVQQVGEICCF